MVSGKRLAMLIDGDNAQASLLNEMLAEASKYGVVTIRRVYGDWTESQMKSWKSILHTHAFQPIQQFRYTVGKNATDSALIIDAMDILYTAGVDGFCLVSSDSDYTRLATRIREKNLFVMGIGKQNTPRSFVNGCDVFVYTENLVTQPITTPRRVKPSRTADSSHAEPTPIVNDGDEPDLYQMFRTAFELAMQENGWAHLGNLGSRLRQLDPGFDPRTYGHKQLSMLVQAHPEVFEIRKTKKTKTGPGGIYVRLKERTS
ncbi:MAG: NYN domain-containing protein [Anaerolineae bacterium]